MRSLNIFSRSVILSLITFCVLSCGKEQKAPITFNVRANKKILIPSTERSCKDAFLGSTSQTVASKYVAFDFPEVEVNLDRVKELYPEPTYSAILSNPNKLTFNIVGINVKIDSENINGGKVRCVIAGEELQYLYFLPSNTGWKPTAISYDATTAMFKGTTYYLNAGYSACPIKCGGISTKEIQFTAPVSFELIVIASLKNDDGTQTDTPYKVITTGTVQNAF